MTGQTLRVLHVYRTYSPDAPGGIQEAIRQIALSTQPYGVESRIFTLSPHPRPAGIQRQEGQVVRARSWAAPASCDLGGPTTFRRFRDEARTADVIHYHFPWPYADLLHLATRPAAPAVMTYHSDIVNKGLLQTLYAPLMKLMLKRMQAVIATSPAYAKSSLVLSQHVPADRLRIIPLGILESTYEPALRASVDCEPARELGLDRNGFFLFIGGLRGYKGLGTLAAAAKDSPLPIVIAGIGKEEAVVEQMTRTHPHVHHLKTVDDATKLALLRDCRALVLPSDRRSEAFGMVLIEASMMGRPAISTRLGTGTDFVNKHEETGLCVEPGNPDDLARAFHALMDEHRAHIYGQQARARYEKLFSGTALGENHAQLYREVAAARQ